MEKLRVRARAREGQEKEQRGFNKDGTHVCTSQLPLRAGCALGEEMSDTAVMQQLLRAKPSAGTRIVNTCGKQIMVVCALASTTSAANSGCRVVYDGIEESFTSVKASSKVTLHFSERHNFKQLKVCCLATNSLWLADCPGAAASRKVRQQTS